MENQKEEWRDVVGYEGKYQVSSFGRIKSLSRQGRKNDKILKLDSYGNYLKVNLYRNLKRSPRTVHQLVAESFKGHKPNGFKSLIVNHIDLDKKNNHSSNLELTTQRINGNRKHLESTSKYTGVWWHKRDKVWQSEIVNNGKLIYLGTFINELEASKYYEDALIAIKNNQEIKTKKPDFSSSYKGVCWDKNKNRWVVNIHINGKQKYIGIFKKELDAAKAYKDKLKSITA